MGYEGFLKGRHFEITQDGSAGLYDEAAGDILHSKTGALKEAREKFIMPVLDVMPEIKGIINILDICYGIGYNTKAALTDLTAFKGAKLNIDALECDKDLILLSPFITDSIKDDDLKIFLADEISHSALNRADTEALSAFILNKENYPFISAFTRRFIERFNADGYKDASGKFQQGLLHNIYYRYISSSMKIDLKSSVYNKSIIRFFIQDARKSISLLDKKYDLVFLDAFSPKKNPCLWTIDFLSCVKSKMKENSILVSYSMSAPFRSALLMLGFFCGKTFINEKESGTIASLNSAFIKNKLDKHDIDIINTRSGIPFRDKTLSLPPQDILKARELEAAASDRISRTKFEKLNTSV